MDIAALITWVLTAVGGFYLLATWISKGGHREPPEGSKFPPAVIFGHFALAAIGLVVWIVFVAVDKTAVAWIAFVILLPVALLGFVMLARWIPTFSARSAVAAHATGSGAVASGSGGPAERHFPVVVVAGHGVLAVVTVVLVLLSALGLG